MGNQTPTQVAQRYAWQGANEVAYPDGKPAKVPLAEVSPPGGDLAPPAPTLALTEGQLNASVQTAIDAALAAQAQEDADQADPASCVARLTRQIAVNQVAARHKLEPDLVALLEQNVTVTDEASAEKAAKLLASLKTKVIAPPTDAGSGNRRTATASGATADSDGEQSKRYGWQSGEEVAYP
jgi:hypothetical protein